MESERDILILASEREDPTYSVGLGEAEEMEGSCGGGFVGLQLTGKV